MKNIYIRLSFVLVFLNLNAQNIDTKTADKLFRQYEFINASKEYLKIVDNNKANDYVYKQLGDCYYNIFNSIEAEKWYAKAISSPQDAETYFRYAQMLKANKKYDEANIIMKIFASLAPKDLRAANVDEEATYLSKILASPKLFEVSSIELNSKYSEFSALLNDNTIYFASARNENTKSDSRNNQYKMDLYKVDYSVDGKLSGQPVAFTDLNSKFHEGPLCFSSDGKTVYFSRESFFEKQFQKSTDKKINYGKMFLYKASLNNGKWENITSLPINGKEFDCSNPSISKDGKTLYFASNRPGGIGGSDIWKVTINSDGQLGNPENMGDKINTEGSENFPFIADDNTLYFSSNGKRGLGGLDVFAYHIDKGTILNIGKPVNSEKDDFGFTFNQSKNIAFLSSNRNGGIGDDDIYFATPICGLDLVVTATNSKTGAIISNATLSINDMSGTPIGNAITNDLGQASFHLECGKDYVVKADHNSFTPNTFSVANGKGGATLNVELSPIEAIVTETEVIVNEIRFDFNKSNITADGAMELDKLVEVMNKYPDMIIFAKSHTDTQGSDKYNLELSEKRVKATIQYIISKGIAPERISGKGYGKSEPKVLCDPCTDEQHAENRRSEFIIIKR